MSSLVTRRLSDSRLSLGTTEMLPFLEHSPIRSTPQPKTAPGVHGGRCANTVTPTLPGPCDTPLPMHQEGGDAVHSISMPGSLYVHTPAPLFGGEAR